jgi:DNA polymerase-3 subunit beta
MKLSCLQENLARGLAVVSRAVATRSTLPVLNNILLSAEQGRLKLAATNLELAITCWIGAKVDEEGATTLPARVLNDFVNSMPPERIEMHLNPKNQTVHLKCARYDANIKGIDAQEFPIIPRPGDGKRVALEAGVLREMIEQTTFAAATDDSRPVLTGVLTRFEKNKVTFAAADGYRLSVRHALLSEPVEQSFSVIVPAKALQEVARVSGDQEDPVIIAVTENQSQVLFQLTNIEIVSQLIEGQFPDFTRIIPTAYNTRAVVVTAELQNAVKASLVFARESMNTVRLNITPANEMGGGKLTIAATSAESGDNVGDIDATVEGDSLEIAFNARYLLDVLNAAHSSQVVMEMTASASPGVFRAVGRDDFVHVIMPMHIGK